MIKKNWVKKWPGIKIEIPRWFLWFKFSTLCGSYDYNLVHYVVAMVTDKYTVWVTVQLPSSVLHQIPVGGGEGRVWVAKPPGAGNISIGEQQILSLLSFRKGDLSQCPPPWSCHWLLFLQFTTLCSCYGYNLLTLCGCYGYCIVWWTWGLKSWCRLVRLSDIEQLLT